MQISYDYKEMVKITPNNIITYDKYIGDRRCVYRDESKANLSLSKNKNDMSKKAQRRLLAAMDWLLLIARPKSTLNMKSNKTFTYKLSLVTLTLPCDQLHDDNFIKKYMLNEFLTRLRKEYNLRNYLWKAEKQFNGNIHFHLVIDKYCHYKDLNHIWNQILLNHGYIEKYRKNQEEHHKNGFTPRPEMFSYWNVQAQLKAYKDGVRTNWTEPTATTDIHSLRKIKNAKAYLAKYLTKNPDTGKYYKIKVKEWQRANSSDTVPTEILEEIKEHIKSNMKVTGNLWYISRSLSKLKGCTTELTDELKEELENLSYSFNDKIERLERCILHKFNILQLISYGCNNLVSAFVKYIADFRHLFYPKDEPERNYIGLALPIFEV